jgi:SAM-dependent methyltransferase
MKRWHENDNFWEDFAPKIFTEDQWAHAAKDVTNIISLLHIHKGARILDLCCGPGRHSLEFSRRGYAVTAVDRTSKYLIELKEKANKENLTLEIIHEDMRNYLNPASFEVALNLFTSFGYFEKEEENIKVLENIHASLKEKGQLIIELMGKEVLARIFRERDWHEKDGVIYLGERKLNDNWSWITDRWIRIEGNNRREYTITHRLYSGIELLNLLKSIGFSDIELYGSLGGIPYDNKAERLVAVAKKYE